MRKYSQVFLVSFQAGKTVVFVTFRKKTKKNRRFNTYLGYNYLLKKLDSATYLLLSKKKSKLQKMWKNHLVLV